MFRKDPVAVSEWSGENVEICWQRQRRIVTDIWPCLKSGGILIYSTCTYNTKETKRTSVGYGMNSGRRYCRWKFLLTGILRVIYCRERTFPPIVSCPIGRRGKDSFGSSPQTGRERWEYLGRAGEILGKGRKPQGKERKLRVFPKNSFRHCMSGLRFRIITNLSSMATTSALSLKRISPNCRLCVRHSVSCRLG